MYTLNLFNKIVFLSLEMSRISHSLFFDFQGFESLPEKETIVG